MKTEKQMKEKKHVSGSQKGGQTTEKLKKRIADHKLMAVVAIIIVIGIIYLLGTLYFRNHFLPTHSNQRRCLRRQEYRNEH